MEEASTFARTPCTCFEIYSGDHQQTPGGLQQIEAIAARLLQALARFLRQEINPPPGLVDPKAALLILWMAMPAGRTIEVALLTDKEEYLSCRCKSLGSTHLFRVACGIRTCLW